jgi:predicted DNA-binding transcriptional regulator AlpA
MTNLDDLIDYYGSKQAMADELGISYPTLFKKLKERRPLLVYLEEFKQKTGLSADEILKMINPNHSGELSE